MKNDSENSNSRIQELIAKYNIDIEALKSEQIKLAKKLELKDKIDFSLADKFGGIENIFINNKILSCIIVCDKNFEIIDRAYALEKLRFPYLSGFRNYREMDAMMIAFEKLSERPDVIFVSGQGITHPRLGLASHFGLAVGIPTIGIANSILNCKFEELDSKSIFKQEKEVGKVLITKLGSNPMFVSPGHLISVKSAYDISKSLINLPHKKPEPIHLAGKYARNVKSELVD